MRSAAEGMFYRINDEGNAVVLHEDDGSAVTRLDASVYPIDSDVSARYDHPDGIVLTVEDARSIGLRAEDE